MDKPKKAAVIQLNATNSLQAQLEKTEALSRQAVAEGAQLIVVPETFVYYGEKDFSRFADLESTHQGTVRSRLSSLAKELQAWIVGGTLPLWPEPRSEHSRPNASTLVFDDAGELQGRYNKIHLFDVDLPEQNRFYRESDQFTPGTGETLVFDSPVGKVGVVICFDLRFPGLALKLREQGAEIIVAPAAFTRETGKAHWRLLLQARALDTQCYLLGANLAGRDAPKPVWGGSAAVDPWGRVLAELDDQDGFFLVDIDLQKQAAIRANLPLGSLRRV